LTRTKKGRLVIAMPNHMGIIPFDRENDCKVLFRAVAAGDEIAFERLFERFRASVFSLSLKWTKSNFSAEEITQEVFISIWTSRAHLPEVKDPIAYIYTIVYNKISRYLKKEENKARILRMTLWNQKEFANDTEEAIYLNEGHSFVRKALSQLPPRQKMIYQLSRQEGRTNDEIATRLNISPHTVKSHLITAMKFIRNYLKNNALSVFWLLLSLTNGVRF